MIKKYCVVIVCSWAFESFSQNLISNPSFEDTVTCPSSIGQIYDAQTWFEATPSGSSEYYNSCSINPDLTVPNNYNGYQFARTGNAYAGISPYFQSMTFREYISTKLTDSLIANKIYYIEFYVSLGDSASFAINSIGAYLSHDSLTDTSVILPYTPQVSNPVANIITDKINWVKISGYFKAVGGEKYLTIGNFNTDANTDTTYLGGNNPLAYYYIDDVSVMDSLDVGINESKNDIAINVFPNPTTEVINFSCSETVQEVFITDVLGQGVVTAPKPTKREINVSSFPQGIYFLNVRTANGAAVRKIIKQ